MGIYKCYRSTIYTICVTYNIFKLLGITDVGCYPINIPIEVMQQLPSSKKAIISILYINQIGFITIFVYANSIHYWNMYDILKIGIKINTYRP